VKNTSRKSSAGPANAIFAPGALNIESAANGSVEAHEGFAGTKAARNAGMTLDEFGLLFHVLVM
jgi:hypothetical protein